MTTKLIISSLFGIGALGGATVGGYYWLSNKDSEKSQKVENETNNQRTGTTTNQVDTQKTKEPAVAQPKLGTSVQAPADPAAKSSLGSTTVSREGSVGDGGEVASGVGSSVPGA